MATLLEDMVAYFVDLGLVEGDGEDTYRDFKPEAPDNIVSLHEYKGDDVSRYTNVVHRSVQVVVRNTNATVAHDLAWDLYNALADADEAGRIDFTSDRWGQVHLRQTPHKFSQDANDRVHYGFNVGITTYTE